MPTNPFAEPGWINKTEKLKLFLLSPWLKSELERWPAENSRIHGEICWVSRFIDQICSPKQRLGLIYSKMLFSFLCNMKTKRFSWWPFGALVSQSSTVGKWWGSIWESPLLYTEARRGSYQAVSFFFNAQGLSPVQLLVTPWTVACQAPLSMEFPSFFFFFKFCCTVANPNSPVVQSEFVLSNYCFFLIL